MLNTTLIPTLAATRFKSMTVSIFNVNQNNEFKALKDTEAKIILTRDKQPDFLDDLNVELFSCDPKAEDMKDCKLSRIKLTNVAALKTYFVEKKAIHLQNLVLDCLDYYLKNDVSSQIMFTKEIENQKALSITKHYIEELYNLFIRGSELKNEGDPKTSTRFFKLKAKSP